MRASSSNKWFYASPATPNSLTIDFPILDFGLIIVTSQHPDYAFTAAMRISTFGQNVVRTARRAVVVFGRRPMIFFFRPEPREVNLPR
jgi:hypothetical protein